MRLPGLLLAPNRQGFFSSHRNPALANMFSFWVSCQKLHSFCAVLCLTFIKKSCLNFAFFILLLPNSFPDTIFHLLQISSSFSVLFLFRKLFIRHDNHISSTISRLEIIELQKAKQVRVLRTKFVSQILTQILIKFHLQNPNQASTSKSQPNISISNKLDLQNIDQT